MFKKMLGNISPVVFWVSAAVAGLFVLWGIISPNQMSTVVNATLKFLIDNFGWSYLLGVMFFVFFVVLLAFSKYGSIKLGKDDDEPEYSTFAWFTMLFSAGMGIGLVFWSIAEPITHYANPPFGQGKTPDAVETAMRYAFFHWGLHPWAIFVVVGMALAYAQFRKGLPGLISSTLYPVLGERINGPWGKAVDILAVWATLFGVATSLGLGALQINSGLEAVFHIPNNNTVTVIIIAVVTVLFITSAVTGIERGILWLSNTNVIIAVLLMIFMLAVGPTRFILNLFTDSLGTYFQNIIRMSFWTDPVKQGGWVGGWTIFYWAWWIAWAPFVGGFIARISKGRTIREFLIGVLVAPTVFSLIFISVFGGAGLHLALFTKAGIVEAVKANVASALFVTLSQYPLGVILSTLAIILIGTFFITSADSATFVVAMLTSGGDLHPKTGLKVTWGVVEGAIAAVLLLSGGLTALQTASIAAAFPFMIVMFFMCYAMYKAVKMESSPELAAVKSGKTAEHGQTQASLEPAES